MPKSRWQKMLLLALLLPGAGCASLLPTPAAPLPTSALAGENTIVVAAQGPPRQTLPQFLGVGQFARVVGGLIDRLRNRLGMRFPALEATPPLLSITDPANADSPTPAVAAAAAAKAEEDAAPQKIKAIRYLAKLGCQECYPDTLPSLIEALSDCTESVRYEAAKALRTLTDGPCKTCRNGTCCTPELVEALEKVVNERNAVGNPAEPSERVRRVARVALENCQCAAAPAPQPESDIEGPTPASPDETPAEGPIPVPVEPASSSAASRSPIRRAYDVVVARVNNEPIYQREIVARVEQRLHQMRLQAGHDAAGEDALRPQLFAEEISRAIDQTLLLQQARRSPTFTVARVGFETPPGERARSSSPIDSPAEFSGESLAAAKMSAGERAEAWLSEQLAVDQQVSPAEIRAHYDARREEFRRAAEIRWECATVSEQQFGSPEAAQAVLAELRARAQGGPAAAPPSRELQSVEVQSFDWTPLGELPSPEIVAAAERLPVGEISPVVTDAAGFHVLRVLARRPQRLLTLEEAAPRIRERILAERRRGPRQEYLARLRRQADIWKLH